MASVSMKTMLELWASSLHDVKSRIAPLFTQKRVAASAGLFLDGLLGPERRKTGWMRAEAAGDPGPWRQQAILGRGRWDADTLRDYTLETMADRSTWCAGAVRERASVERVAWASSVRDRAIGVALRGMRRVPKLRSTGRWLAQRLWSGQQGWKCGSLSIRRNAFTSDWRSNRQSHSPVCRCQDRSKQSLPT